MTLQHPKTTFVAMACLLLGGGIAAGYFMRTPQVNQLTAKLESVTQTNERTQSTLQGAERELASTRETSNILQTERNELEERLQAAETRVAELAGCVVTDEDGRMLPRAEIEAMRDNLDASRDEISKLNEQVRTATYEKSDLQRRIASLEEQTGALNDNIESLLEDNERLAALVEDKSERVYALEISEQILSNELADSRQTLAAAQPDVDRARRLSSQYSVASLESRRITATGRQLAGSGNPVSGLLNFIGDAFVGTVEAIGGPQGDDTYFLTCEGFAPLNLGTNRDRAIEQFRSITGREP